MNAKEYDRARREKLTDSYVRDCLKKRGFTNITASMIEVERKRKLQWRANKEKEKNPRPTLRMRRTKLLFAVIKLLETAS